MLAYIPIDFSHLFHIVLLAGGVIVAVIIAGSIAAAVLQK